MTTSLRAGASGGRRRPLRGLRALPVPGVGDQEPLPLAIRRGRSARLRRARRHRSLVHARPSSWSSRRAIPSFHSSCASSRSRSGRSKPLLASGELVPVESSTVAGETHTTWQEGVPRDGRPQDHPPARRRRRAAPDRGLGSARRPASAPCSRTEHRRGRVTRRRWAVDATLLVSAQRIGALLKVGVRIENDTRWRAGARRRAQRALRRAAIGTHVLLGVLGGRFLSLARSTTRRRRGGALLQPPARLADPDRRPAPAPTPCWYRPSCSTTIRGSRPRAPATSTTPPRSTRSSRCAS